MSIRSGSRRAGPRTLLVATMVAVGLAGAGAFAQAGRASERDEAEHREHRERRAHEAEHGRAERPGSRTDSDPSAAAYLRECGGCHVAFPPQLLGASGWRTLMSGLDRHFGVDASLEPAESAAIGAWLQAKAGPADRLPSNSSEAPRITTTPWLVRKHDEVQPQAWKRPRIEQASNCAACHPGAERGHFDEDDVRIPR